MNGSCLNVVSSEECGCEDASERRFLNGMLKVLARLEYWGNSVACLAVPFSS